MAQAGAVLAELWSMLDGDPELPGRVTFSGPEHVLSSVFDVTTLAVASVAVATLAVAEVGAARSRPARGSDPVALHEVPDVGADRLAASAAFRSEALLIPHGWQLPPPWDPIAGDYRTADGWIRLHTNYAYHRAAALRALGLGAEAGGPDGPGGPGGSQAEGDPAAPSQDEVAARVQQFGADDLERRVVAEGGCAAALRTARQWRAHPHGAIALGQPPVAAFSRPLGTATPLGRSSASEPRPLAGVRVLDLTRVIAGPVCTRTLAAWGADVLRIDPPGFAEVPALLPETTVGKHCAELDLRTIEGRQAFGTLIQQADVVVHGLRPGALDGLGWSDRELGRLNPALCIAELDAYGWAGPWAGRRGFDSLVQFSCGIAAAGAAAPGDIPRSLPAQALDHATGYVLAAAICRALTRRALGAPPAGIRAALVGTANLLMRLPDRDQRPARRGERLVATQARDTSWGPVVAVPHPGTIAGAAADWPVPAGPLGRHPPRFQDRA